MFFDIFSELCEKKGVSRYRACTDIGLNRAAVAKWKNGAIPTGSTLSKLSVYFGVSTDYLLGKEQQSKSQTPDSVDSDVVGSEFFRIMQDAKNKGFTPRDLQLALNFLEDARRRDQNR